MLELDKDSEEEDDDASICYIKSNPIKLGFENTAQM